MAAQTDNGVLRGVRALEVGGELGAWCGKLLADMGASVTKIEPPSGDPTRSYPPFYQDRPHPDRSLYFWHYNTNKKSITLDINTEAGRDVFTRLSTGVDVVIDSLPAEHLDELGIGYDALRRANPKLVMVAVTPFGQHGPYKHYAATDLTALAFGGPAWSCGYDDHSLPPVRGGGNQGYHTVGHFAVMGVMIALLHRQHTGAGQFIDANMHAAQNVTTEAGSYTWLVAKDNVQRQTGRHASIRRTAPSQVRCRDGRYINVGFPARTEEQWLHLLAWLEEEGVVGDLNEYLSPPSRSAMAQGDLEAIEQLRKVSTAIEALAQRMNGYDMFRRAQELGFQWGIIYAPEEVIDDPHFRARGFAAQVEHPELGESFTYPGAPYKLPASPWAIHNRAPLLGEHNDAIYIGELGLTPDELSSLKRAGAV